MNEAPSSFGKYFLTEKIATGGMAEIYLAKLVGPGGFEKFLIIKKIHPEFSGERQFVEMFVAEAKTLVSLSHGNIVPIYELGMVDSTYFIAMEYIDGPTVEQLQTAMKRNERGLSTTMSAYICAEVLKGLDYAHRKGDGVIHRDLSPRNVMLSREGEVKLVDFGIAVGHAPGGRLATHRPLTGGEGPTGSYPHMSPEQARGEELDPRSDLFAVGILLWELLAGKSLFARADDDMTLAAVLAYSIPPPSEFCPEASGVLDAICARALERDVDKRYRNAEEFLVALNRYLYSQAQTVSPSDVSRVVALNCPPTASRLARPSTEARPKRSGTVPMARPDDAAPARSGTVPMAPPQGKARAETVRTFATHVQFQKVLSSATPMHGVPIVDTDADANTGSNAPPDQPTNTDESAAEADGKTEEPDAVLDPSPAASGPVGATQEIRRQRPERRNMPLLIAGLLAIAGLGAAVAVLSSSKQPAAPSLASSDAATATTDAAIGNPVDADIVPAIVDAGALDARPADAARRPPRRRPDARPAAALGSVRVAANPWADVYLKGKRLGRAPGSFPVPAGTHQLELRNGEQSKRVTITVTAGELTSMPMVDFTRTN